MMAACVFAATFGTMIICPHTPTPPPLISCRLGPGQAARNTTGALAEALLLCDEWEVELRHEGNGAVVSESCGPPRSELAG